MKHPVMPSMCGTCPFRDNGLVCVRGLLQERALNEASPICHSTGKTIGVGKLVSRKALLCRGARNFLVANRSAAGYSSGAVRDRAAGAESSEKTHT